MKTLPKKFFLLLVFCTLSCSTSVDINYNKHIDFSQYKAFTWMSKAGSVQKPGYYDQIKFEIDAQLQAKGYKKGGDPDFGLTISTGAYGQISQTEYGFGHVKETETGETGLQYFSEGTLVLDIIDIKTKQQSWRSSVTVINRDPDNPQKAVKEAVSKLLEKFPPERDKGKRVKDEG